MSENGFLATSRNTAFKQKHSIFYKKGPSISGRKIPPLRNILLSFTIQTRKKAMARNWLIKLLVLPLALLYGLGVGINNLLHRFKLLKSITFSLPVISIGNLTVGGSGKSPHAEYLIKLLKPHIRVGVISRGYGRKSKGFQWVNVRNKVSHTGDEPLQIKRKNPDIPVAVSESRSFGIPKMVGQFPQLQTIIMDDGFQHREVNPTLNLLLTEYSSPYFKDFLLPVGRLREWPTGSRRADAIIVSKCPTDLTSEQAAHFQEKLKPLPQQKVFFSYLTYGQAYYLFNPKQKLVEKPGGEAILLTGIANPDPLIDHMAERVDRLHSLAFPDHHNFSTYDLAQLKKTFDQLEMKIRFVVTTEKDAVRLEPHVKFLADNKIHVFIQPVEVAFHRFSEFSFDDYVKNKLLEFKS